MMFTKSVGCVHLSLVNDPFVRMSPQLLCCVDVFDRSLE